MNLTDPEKIRIVPFPDDFYTDEEIEHLKIYPGHIHGVITNAINRQQWWFLLVKDVMENGA